MKFKKFFKSRTLRVILATVFILSTLFTFFVVSASAVDLPSDLPDEVYMPPQIPANFSYEYGLPKSALSCQRVYSIFFYQNYFGGFNTHHPVAIFVIPSGSSYLTYLICTDNEADGIWYDPATYYIYFSGVSTGSEAGGTVYYYLLTDYGFVYDHQTVFNQQFVVLDSTSNSTSVMWWLNVTTYNWSWGSNYVGTGVVDDTDSLYDMKLAFDRWNQYYYTVTTLNDRQEIYDDGYDTGVNDGYRAGYADGRVQGENIGYQEGYDIGYVDGFRAGQVGYYLDIGSIFDGLTKGAYNLVNTAFNFELFGVNISGLLFLIVGVVIIVFVVRFIWGFIK